MDFILGEAAEHVARVKSHFEEIAYVETFDLAQGANKRNITQRWTKQKHKNDFTPGPGTVIAGFNVKNCDPPKISL